MFRCHAAYLVGHLMAEKSLSDLAIGDAHLREERISGEAIYDGIFLKLNRA